MDLRSYIKDVPDFPKEGIVYRDIQPLLADGTALIQSVDALSQFVNIDDVDYFVGVESRGFIFASMLATMTGKGFKMIRKAGKLPDTQDVLRGIEYDLEYGSAKIEMLPGEGNVVIVDDVYATGGTMNASKQLCEMSGYNVVDKLCLIDIGIQPLHDVKCLITY